MYRYLDIGSAKPEPQIRKHIPHYLIDIRDPWEQFSVGDFVHLADEACTTIRADGKVPVVCGGTAYYFKHFYFGLPHAPKSDPMVRRQIATLVREKGNAWSYQRLQEVDPLSAQRIHPSDTYRITRALEVYEATNKPLSSFAVPESARKGMEPLIIGLYRDKEELGRRIEERVAKMFAQGLEEEIARLQAMGANKSWPGMQAIGYREFFLDTEKQRMDSKEIADRIIYHSKLYAKRQMVFFKSLPNVHWVHPDDTETIKKLIDLEQDRTFPPE